MLNSLRFLAVFWLSVLAIAFAIFAKPILAVICGGLTLMLIFWKEW